MSSFRRLNCESLEVRDVPSVALVSIMADNPSVSEGGDPGRFTVSRSGGDMSLPLTVLYHLTSDTTASADDYGPLTGEVVIPAGATSATIAVMPVDDGVVEPTEMLGVELCNPPTYCIDPKAFSARIAIGDNDTAPASPQPVLMVIANRDFYYQEYADTRAALEAAGVPVIVAAQTVAPSYPHANSGQGSTTGMVMPDIALGSASASDYSAIVFVGGWGASSYQYAFAGTYANAAYNGAASVEAAANELINDFIEQDKYVCGLCHGVSVLAWARVDGVSPIAGKTVSAYGSQSPAFQANGTWSTPTQQMTRWHVETNGATMVQSRSVGNPTTATDDVIVDGRIITAENYDSARQFGRTIAAALQS